MEQRVEVRRRLIRKCLPLTPTLSPFGGERESDPQYATVHWSEAHTSPARGDAGPTSAGLAEVRPVKSKIKSMFMRFFRRLKPADAR